MLALSPDTVQQVWDTMMCNFVVFLDSGMVAALHAHGRMDIAQAATMACKDDMHQLQFCGQHAQGFAGD